MFFFYKKNTSISEKPEWMRTQWWPNSDFRIDERVYLCSILDFKLAFKPEIQESQNL